MNDLVVSLIRTLVPLAVGGLISWLATVGVTGVDSEAAIIAVTTITTGVYYAAARALEEKVPNAGVLLGHKTAPSYE